MRWERLGGGGGEVGMIGIEKVIGGVDLGKDVFSLDVE